MAIGGKTEIRGELACETSVNGLSAVLKFSPGGGLRRWDLADLVEYLAGRGVKEGYSASKLETVLKELGSARDPAFEVEVARGVAPEPPRPERPAWLELPVPERFQRDLEPALAKAGPPVVYSERIERVRVEKVVPKKAPFPFMPASTEKITVTETRTIRERVNVDPTVEATGWIEAGGGIAAIEPARQGVPGKSVAGELIHVQALAEPLVYCGQGVERRDNQLVAARTGYLRRGGNWAEVLAFRPHVWEVRRSADNATCLFDFAPGERAASLPSGREILEIAAGLGFEPGSLLMPAQIEELLSNSLSSGQPLRAASLSASADAFCEVKISEDKLRAVLNVRKGRGRARPLVLKEVGAAIKAAKLKDADYEKIKQDLLEFYRGEKLELSEYPLAGGKTPTAGEARTFEWQLRFLDDKARDAAKNEALRNPGALEKIASTADFPMQAVQAVGAVEKDQRVVLLGPVGLGQPGIDVHGAAIAAQPGPEPKFKLHENLEQKQNVIIAAAPGMLDRGELDGIIHLRVRPHKDCEISASVSPSRMEAYLTLYAEEGTGAELTREKVDAAVAKAGISFGLIDGAVAEAILEAKEKGGVVEKIIAGGAAPLSGSESSVSFLVTLASGKSVKIHEDGRADFRSHDSISVVAKGTRIAEVLPPAAQPAEGTDVTGKSIPVKSGAAVGIDAGANVDSVQEDGKIVLIAAVDGEIIYDEKARRLEVVPTYSVKGNLDMAVGNIKFPGTVAVSGSVYSGFFVLAGGDILIGESVEAALLSAEGGIGIKQGVRGMGKAVLRSKKEVQAGFVERTTVLAVGDVKLKSACMFSSIKTNGRLELYSEKGHLIGGTVKARSGVSAMNIGSENGGKVHISFGQDYLVGDQIEIEERELKKLAEASAIIDGAMREAERAGDKAKVDRLRAEKLRNMKIVEKRSLRLFTLREKYEEHFPSEVRVRGTIFPGVVLESHGRFHETTAAKKGVSFSFNRETGRIEESQPAKEKEED